MTKLEIIEKLFNEYWASLCYNANKILEDKEKSKDAVGNAFLRLVDIEFRNDNYASIRKLLFIISRQEAYRIYFSDQQRERRENIIAGDYPEFALDPVMDIIRRETMRNICKTLETFPDRRKEIARMILSGQKGIHIAEKLGLKPSTVKRQWHLIIGSIKERYFQLTED